MSWEGDVWSKTVIQIETGSKFIVNYHSRVVNDPDDIDIIPEKAGQWRPDELTRLKSELCSHWEHQARRSQLSSIIRKELYGDMQEAASIISTATGKNVSVRTVQSWIMPLHRPSSRTCPPWALNSLKAYLTRPENKPVLELIKQASSTPNPSKISAINNESVAIATFEIEEDKRKREKWRNTSTRELPDKIHDEIENLRASISYLSRAYADLSNAIRTTNDFSELKEKVAHSEREQDLGNAIIRSTKNAITENKDEFSNNEGLLDN